MTIRLIIVSDIRLYREGLEQVLSADTRLCVVETAASAEEALQQISTTPFDMILVDISMDAHDALLRQIVARMPTTKILALAVPESTEAILACIEAGVSGYITRASSRRLG